MHTFMVAVTAGALASGPSPAIGHVTGIGVGVAAGGDAERPDSGSEVFVVNAAGLPAYAFVDGEGRPGISDPTPLVGQVSDGEAPDVPPDERSGTLGPGERQLLALIGAEKGKASVAAPLTISRPRSKRSAATLGVSDRP